MSLIWMILLSLFYTALAHFASFEVAILAGVTTLVLFEIDRRLNA